MKKSIVFIILLSTAFILKAQETVVLRIKYLPDRKYISNTVIEDNTEMNISADKETLDKMKSNGMQLPIIVKRESQMGIEVKTGSLNDKKEFPVTFSFIGVHAFQTINGKKKEGPDDSFNNMKIYAHDNSDGKLFVDSISNKENNDTLTTVISNMINKVLSEVKYPEAPMKIGESFNQEIPITMPFAGNSVKILLKINYKLTDIKNNSAFFDIVEMGDVSFSTGDGSLEMIGKGDGKMVFDIKNSYSTSRSTNLIFNYTMKRRKILMTGILNTSSLYKISID